MQPEVLSPVGVRVRGLLLADIDDCAVATMRELLALHGVLVLPGQEHVDDTTFVRFLKRFGQPTFSIGEQPLEGFPDLNVISNVGRTTTPRSVFHVDTSYVRRPPAYTALRAVQIPEQGGETLFTNQYRAFETLPEPLRERLAGRTLRHVVTGLDLGPDDEREADHPVFSRHPISGRTALFISTPERCVSVSGLDEAEGRELIEQLYAHATTEDNTLRHAWAPGDVVMWDNRCVLHRADHADVVGDRVMHRGMVTAFADA